MRATLTLDSYEFAVDQFVMTLAPIHLHIHAVYLFGSFARGEAIVGYSDLDFWIFFKPELWDNETSFFTMLDTLDRAMWKIQELGIPMYHLCGYESIVNLEQLPPLVVSTLRDRSSCQLLFGQDIRDQLPETAIGNHISTFFEMRRQLFLPLLPLLNQESLNKKERQMIFQALQYVKYLPEAICASLNKFPAESGVILLLSTLLPTLDLTPIAPIKTYCASTEIAGLNNELQSTAVLAVNLIEEINSTLLTYLKHEQ